MSDEKPSPYEPAPGKVDPSEANHSEANHSEANHSEANHSDLASSANETNSSASSGPSLPRLFVRLAIVAVLVFALLAWLQGDTAEADFQVANMISAVIVLMASIYAFFVIQRFLKRRGKRWVLPLLIAIALVAFISTFRFDGFSGEMMPLFSYRSDTKRAIRTLEEDTQPTNENVADSVVSSNEQPSIEETSQYDYTGSNQAFTQFLGDNRTGVISNRAFKVPVESTQAKVLWDQGVGQGWASFAISDGLAITLEQRDEEECIAAYKVRSGDPVWLHSHTASHFQALGGAGPRSTPTIDNGRVYAQGASGNLWCLDLFSGDVIWEVDLLETAGWTKDESESAITWGRAASPLIVGELCVIPLGGPLGLGEAGRSLAAFRSSDGQLVWQSGDDQISYASPILMNLAGQQQIVTVNEASVTGHLPETGQQLWSFVWPGQSSGGANCASAMPAGRNRFLVGKGYGGGSAVVEITNQSGNYVPEVVWESKSLLKTKFNHACIIDGVAYGLSNGTLESVDLEEARKLWRQPRSKRYGQGQVIAVDDVLVVQAESGDIAFVEVNRDSFNELARLAALEHKTWNIPSIAGDLLIVRNDRRAICYQLPPR